MGNSSLDGKDGECIKSAMDMLVRFTVKVGPQLANWEQRLRENPAELDTIEHEIRNEYLRGAGMKIAGLVSVVLQSKELARASEQTRRHFSNPLAKGRERKIAVRVLGGVLMWVTSLCPSIERAQAELNREGLSMSTKAIRRVAQQCGEDLLKFRTIQLQQWRAGTLKSTSELTGKQGEKITFTSLSVVV